MEAVRRADPNYVGYKARCATDAVERFCRMQRNGLPSTQIPEALIDCAKGLSDAEIDKFETWIICPNDVKGCIDASVIGAENQRTHKQLLREHHERLNTARTVNQEDEKDEKVPDPEPVELGHLSTVVETQTEE